MAAGGVRSSNAKFQMTEDLVRQIQCEAERVPRVKEFDYLARHFDEPESKQRSRQLLDSFKNMYEHDYYGLTDVWYGQLDSLVAVATTLGDKDAASKAFLFNDRVREACRKAPHVESEEQIIELSEQSAAESEHVPHSTRSSSQWSSNDVDRRSASTSSGYDIGDREPVRESRRESCLVDPVILSREIPGNVDVLTKEGYQFEEKEIGKQHVVPSPAKLDKIKEACVETLEENFAFCDAVRSETGVDILGDFKKTVSKPFDIDDFFTPEEGSSLSPADIYTHLSTILIEGERKCDPSHTVVKEIFSSFREFRDIFGFVCNPQRNLLQVFQGISGILKIVLSNSSRVVKLVQTLGRLVVSMFSTMFAAVLDLLGGAITSLTSPSGAGALMAGGLAASLLLPVVLGPVLGVVGVAAVAAGRVVSVAGFAAFGAGLGAWLRPQGGRAAGIYFANLAGRWQVFAVNIMP